MKRVIKLLSRAGATLLVSLISIQGAIMVEPTGTTVETFVAQPAVTEWSTLGFGGVPADYTSAAAMDTSIKDGISAADVSTALGSSSTQPPSASNVARRNTDATRGRYVQMRPNNAVGYILLMATLQNNTGGAVPFLNVSYDFGTAMGTDIGIGEEIPGLRAFYSMTGDFGSWVAIPQFTTATVGPLTATLDVGAWADGATMYILWADDDGSLHTSGASQEGTYTIDNFQAVPTAGREPDIISFSGNANGWTAQIQDGTGNLTINQSTIAATVNGTAATPLQVSKAGDIFTVSYASPTPLASNSANDVVFTFNDNATPANSYSITRSLVVAPYLVVPASAAVTGVDTTKSGFKARMHQIGAPRAPGDRNSIANAEKQILDGFIDPATTEPYPNLALDPGTPDGAYAIDTVINWNQDAPEDAGNFTSTSAPVREDAPIPGIDLNVGSDDIVAEVLTYLELKAGIVYRMGVNSDDGFKVTVGRNPRDVFSLVLGSFNTSRGVADSTFDFTVEADGIYPFRLLWWEGGSGAAVEWFTVTPSGEKVLINDRENLAAIKAYAVGPTAPLYVKSVSPTPGDTNAPGNVVIEIKLEDASTAVVPGSVKLVVNNSDVTSAATIAKPAGSTETTITYDPPGVLPPETALNVHLEFADNATPAVTHTYDYVVKVKPLVILPLNDTVLWSYDRSGDDLGTAWRETAFNDSQWLTGPPLLGEDGSAVEPILTPLIRTRDDGAGQITTFYFRTHFTFNGNPASVNLLLRHVVDDGAVFYLNGVEIDRFGIADGASFTAATFFSDHENAWEGPFLVPKASLRAGDNVLAVEVHQASATSSDFMFGAELFVVNDPNASPARVSSITPANGAVDVSLSPTFTILLEDGTTAVVASTVKLTIDGQVVNAAVNKPAGGILTQVTYTPTTPFATEKVVTGKIEFTDSVGSLITTPFSFTTGVLRLIPWDQTWKYLNTGEDAGTEWKEKAFDDSVWLQEGPGMLAAEDGAPSEPIRTVLTRIGLDESRIITDYFRTHFTFTGDPATARLAIRHYVDDGAIFYLNGQEIHRFYFMPDVTDINYLTPAGVGFNPTDHEGRNTLEGPINIPTSALVAGDNVIAVEVHQNGSGSSDVFFGMELLSYKVDQATETRFTSVTLQVDGSIRIQWTGPGTLQEATSINGTWGDISNAPNPYTATTAGAMKFYRVKQ